MPSAATSPPAAESAQEVRARRFIWRAAMIAGLSGVLFGYDASSINDAIIFITKQFNLSSTMKGVVVSSLLAGATLGALVGGSLADRYGRKPTIMASGGVFIVGVLLAGTAIGVPELIFGRIIIGLAIGITSAVTPLFIAEVAPSDKRGGMVTLYQLSITIGILVAFIAGWALTPSGNWRLMIELAIIPAGLQIFAMTTVPESPRYLVQKGKLLEATDVLHAIRGDGDAAAEIAAIEEVQKAESETRWSDLFKAAVRPALIAGLGMALIQAFTGINAIMYYSTNIFQLAGIKNGDVASLAIGVVNVGTSIVAVFLVNRFGRKPLLTIGLIGMVLSLVIAAGGLLTTMTTFTSWLTVAMVLSFVICFAFSLGPIAWLIISEIFPMAIRGRAASFATMGNWAANLVIGLTFPIIVGDSASKVGVAFLVYAAVGLGSIFFIRSFVPETRNRTLEEIEADLATGFSSTAQAADAA